MILDLTVNCAFYGSSRTYTICVGQLLFCRGGIYFLKSIPISEALEKKQTFLKIEEMLTVQSSKVGVLEHTEKGRDEFHVKALGLALWTHDYHLPS